MPALYPRFSRLNAGDIEPMPQVTGIRAARARTRVDTEFSAKTSRNPAVSAANFFPSRLSLKSLRDAASVCRGCDLYKYATQTVFGEGPARARLMLVGEEPGDNEDLEGHPFVGPAGKLLHRALEAAGIAPRDAYVTNAVKHFKFVERGKRRIHQKPKIVEVRACKPWLEGEIAVVKPRLVVALGATAAQSLLGSTFRLMANRGRLLPGPPRILATIHPSAILRAPDGDDRRAKMSDLVDDLRAAIRDVS
jgi:DNA polymerase